MTVTEPETDPSDSAAKRPSSPSLPGSLPVLDRVLDDLPARFCVACHSILRLAIGPSGVFVLSSDTAGEIERVASDLRRAAADTRDQLAQHLSWVPFVDALLLVRRDGVAPPSVTGVPLDLLPVTLVEGRTVVTDRQLDAVRQLLRQDLLAPWAFCLPGQQTIDLSDSARHPASHH